MHDDGAADDAVRSRIESDTAYFDMVDGHATGVCRQVAEIPRVSMCCIGAGVRFFTRIEVRARARGIRRGAISLLVYMKTMQSGSQPGNAGIDDDFVPMLHEANGSRRLIALRWTQIRARCGRAHAYAGAAGKQAVSRDQSNGRPHPQVPHKASFHGRPALLRRPPSPVADGCSIGTLHCQTSTVVDDGNE